MSWYGSRGIVRVCILGERRVIDETSHPVARELPIFERAVDRGEIDAATDPTLIMDLLAGAVWLRAVFRRLPLDEDFTERAVSVVLEGVGRPEDS